MDRFQRGILSDPKQVLIPQSRIERACWAGGLIIAVVLFFLPINYNTAQLSSVLTTLAVAQASVLAIVFSVSILGIQLVANRYSPRMIMLITSSISFQRTLLLLTVSIAVDLLLLLQLPLLSPRQRMVGLALVSGIAAASGATIFQYVNVILDLSTPEGLLSAYSERMTPEEYRREAEGSWNSNRVSHPMQGPYSVVMSGLSNGEWSTAESGVIEYRNLSNRMITSLSETGHLRRSNNKSRYYFNTPIEDHLPRIASKAIETGENDIALETVDVLNEIGETAINSQSDIIIVQISTGLRNILSEVPNDKQESVRGRCYRIYSTTIVEMSEFPLVDPLQTTLSMYAGHIKRSLRNDLDPDRYRYDLNEFFRHCILQAHNNTLEQYHKFIIQQNVDWSDKPTLTENKEIAPFKLIYTYRRYSTDVLSSIFNYYSRRGEWPGDTGEIIDVWGEIIKQGLDYGMEKYAEEICREHIEISYLMCQIIERGEFEYEGYDPAFDLAVIKEQYESSDAIDEALIKAKKEGLSRKFERERRDLSSPSDKRSYFNEIMDIGPPEMEEYRKWVDDFQRRMDHFYEERNNQ